MGNLQSSTPSSRGGPKSRNKRPSATGTRDWLLGGATRVLRKPVAPAPAAAEVEAATADHVTVTSRDLRRQRTPPARDDDTDHHADEQQQQHRQEHHCSNRRHRNDRDDESARSSSEEEDSSVFADTLTSPQSVYSDARDEPDNIMVVNGGETFGGSTGRTAAAAHQAFTIVKHRKVELNPAKLQSAVANGQVQVVDSAVRRSNTSQLSDGPKDGSVLRRVAKVTLDQATKDQKPVRPKHVPEKLDFRNREKFEGQVLINWLVSSFNTEERRRDARLLLPQICTDLVTAGVIKQIQDKDATVASDLFRSDLMYYWARSELINIPSSSPGRIGQPAWLTDKNLGGVENGKDEPTSQAYSNSEELQEIQNKTVSKQSPFKNGIGAILKENMQDSENISDYSPTKSPKPTSLPIRRKKSLSSLTDKFSTLSIDQSNIPVKQINGNIPDETVIKKVNGVQSPIKRTSISSTPNQNSKDTPSSIQSFNGDDSTVFYTPVGVNDPTYNGLSPITTPKSSSLNKIVFGGLTPIFDPISDNSTIIESADSLLSSPEVAVEAIKCDFSTNSPTLKNESDTIDEKQIPQDVALSSHIDSDKDVSSTINTTSFSPKNNIKTSLFSSCSESPVSPEKCHPIPEISISLPIPPPPPPPPSLIGSTIPPPPPPPPPPFPQAQLTESIIPPPPPLPQLSGSTIPPPPPLPQLPRSTIPPPPPPPLPPSTNCTLPPPPPILCSMPSAIPPPPSPLLNKSVSGFNGPPPPPPPMTGPTPFPAPPIGGWNAQRDLLRKKPITPPVPMRPLYWTRVILKEPIIETYTPTTPDSPDSLKPLWSDLEEAPIPNINEFSQLFSRQAVEPKLAKKKVQLKKKTEEFKQLLDTKRSRNVGILAQSLHLDFSEIENALYNFDTSVVSVEVLQQIYEVSATEEELGLIKGHVAAHPDQPLDKPEQFLLELSEIPHFGERVACLIFQSDFNDALNNIANKLNNMKATSRFLMTSEGLKKVLAIILALGNYMNGGNRQRGQADGFGLEILPKLRDVKSKDNSMTLLHFIVQTYINECKEPMKETLPVPEPSDVDRAAHVTFDDLQQGLKELKIKLAGCKKKADKVILSSAYDSLEPFKTKMESFISMAHRQLENEHENLEESKKLFIKLMRFYQFQPKTSKSLLDVAPKDFFPLWLPFCTDFKDFWNMEQQRIVKEKLLESKRRTKERQQLVRTNKKSLEGLKNQIQSKFK